MKRYMVIERFKDGDAKRVYERLYSTGRGLPEGLHFVESWLGSTDDICWQIMETDDPATFDKWTPYWDDLVEFDIHELKPKPKGN